MRGHSSSSSSRPPLPTSSSSSVPGAREKRPILLSLLFIFALSFATIFSRVFFVEPNAEFIREYDERENVALFDDDNDTPAFRGEDDDENDDVGRSRLRLKTNGETRACARREREEEGKEEEEEEERVKKSWIFQTNAKRLGYVHMASIHPIKNGKILLAAWQGAHKVEGRTTRVCS